MRRKDRDRHSWCSRRHPASWWMSQIKAQVKGLIPGKWRGVTPRIFGPKEEHKVWLPFLKTSENESSVSVILPQDQGKATQVLDGSRQDECWPRKPKAVPPS